MKMLMLLAAVLPMAFPVPVYAKPKIGQDVVRQGPDMTFVDIFLILPDGTHARAQCMWFGGIRPCLIDAFQAEKRIVEPCEVNGPTRCFRNEVYYADRRSNDLTIYAANGKQEYHIIGSW
jgi:hypothetical protein